MDIFDKIISFYMKNWTGAGVAQSVERVALTNESPQGRGFSARRFLQIFWLDMQKSDLFVVACLSSGELVQAGDRLAQVGVAAKFRGLRVYTFASIFRLAGTMI